MRSRDAIADELAASVVLSVALWASRFRGRNGNVPWHRRAVVELLAVVSHLITAGMRYPRLFLFFCLLNGVLIFANSLHDVL